MNTLARDPGQRLIDELLADQQQLTAVERFAWQNHRNGVPAQAKFYRSLIPLDRPRPGEQYAFSVDLDKCSGCKACVAACHSQNGLDEDEMWRGAGLLLGGGTDSPFQQTVTTACHHCVDPACLNGCPVLAYDKDPLTGIVRHLGDQCIGCQYCILKCPYDVPKFSPRRGIVRKCDMCQGRLAVGEAPACVQACPTEAIRITVVNGRDVENKFRGPGGPAESTRNTFLAGTPDPHITLPATRYVSKQPIPSNARPANGAVFRLEPAHWPLVFMLVLTQLAAGLHLAYAALLAGGATPVPALATGGLIALLTGLALSVAHLGRPLRAWRAFLGWRKSWLSREIIGFSVYGALASALAIHPGNLFLAELTGLVAAACIVVSAMIYVDTRRTAWTAGLVFPKFCGATIWLGAAAAATVCSWFAPALTPALARISIFVGAALSTWERISFSTAEQNPKSLQHRRAVTAVELLRPVLLGRAALFVASTILFGIAITQGGSVSAGLATLALAATIASRVLERYTFFAACPAPGMPGGVVE